MTTKIEWCQETINPAPGCSKISEGCQNCYALRMAKRFHGTEKYRGTVVNGEWSGQINVCLDDLLKPLKWKKPRIIFVNSMGDLFNEAIHHQVTNLYDETIKMVLDCPQHTFLFLTKRPERMKFICETVYGNNLPQNMWIGVTAENQRCFNDRVYTILKIPARKHFVSIEPMLGYVDASDALSKRVKGLDWVICGGESGPNARPVQRDWVRGLRDQCVYAGVPFLFKQWGGANKNKTGRLLDGKLWDEMPNKGVNNG